MTSDSPPPLPPSNGDTPSTPKIEPVPPPLPTPPLPTPQPVAEAVPTIAPEKKPARARPVEAKDDSDQEELDRERDELAYENRRVRSKLIVYRTLAIVVGIVLLIPCVGLMFLLAVCSGSIR